MAVFAIQAFGQYIGGEIASSVQARDCKSPTDLIVMATGQANAEIMRGGCPTLNSEHEQPILMSSTKNHCGISKGVCTTLQPDEKEKPVTATTKSTVRRLTPKECERLQGFPDDWTLLGDWVDSKGKKHKEADSPRYRALGNSIATPFWFWLLRRISAQYERPATLGSLFDGIGGFPYCWVRCNGTKSVLWSSEIEEFPMAVVRKHFGDEDQGIEGDIAKYL